MFYRTEAKQTIKAISHSFRPTVFASKLKKNAIVG